MLDVKHLYIDERTLETDVLKEVRAKFPDAEEHFVKSHWRIPEIHQNPDLLSKWALVKRQYLIVGHKAKYTYQPNGRSTDFIGPQVSNGCLAACAYCYVARRKGYANPITIYANRSEMILSLEKHLSKVQGKKVPNQTHPSLWTLDIGCNSDVSVDSKLCNTPRVLIESFRGTNSMASFATKFVNREMLEYDPQGHTRIRFSLMPEQIRKVVDVGTHTTSAKIDAANDFVRAGYEVHFNFSPIIFVEGTRDSWVALFQELNDKLNEQTKKQAACEIIMLTHNKDLHELNLQWHPKGEKLLWRPDLQESKTSLNGAKNIRYERRFKAEALEAFKESLLNHCPWMKIRYAF